MSSAIDKEVKYLEGQPQTKWVKEKIVALKWDKETFNEIKNSLAFTLTTKIDSKKTLENDYRELLHRLNVKILNASYTKHHNRVLDISYLEGREYGVRYHFHCTIDIKNKPLHQIMHFIYLQWEKINGGIVEFSEDTEGEFEPDRYVLYSSKSRTKEVNDSVFENRFIA